MNDQSSTQSLARRRCRAHDEECHVVEPSLTDEIAPSCPAVARRTSGLPYSTDLEDLGILADQVEVESIRLQMRSSTSAYPHGSGTPSMDAPTFQSRFTVITETLRTSATSSSLSSPFLVLPPTDSCGGGGRHRVERGFAVHETPARVVIESGRVGIVDDEDIGDRTARRTAVRESQPHIECHDT